MKFGLDQMKTQRVICPWNLLLKIEILNGEKFDNHHRSKKLCCGVKTLYTKFGRNRKSSQWVMPLCIIIFSKKCVKYWHFTEYIKTKRFIKYTQITKVVTIHIGSLRMKFGLDLMKIKSNPKRRKIR